MHCGSTSMSSLISNISTSGRQPCRKHKEKSKKEKWTKFFYTVVNHSLSRKLSVSRTQLASVLKQQSYSYSGVIHHLLLMFKRKTAAGTLGVRLSFTGPWPSFSSPDTANSAGSEETAKCAGKVLEARLCGGKPAMTVLLVNAKNVLNGSKSSQKAWINYSWILSLPSASCCVFKSGLGWLAGTDGPISVSREDRSVERLIISLSPLVCSSKGLCFYASSGAPAFVTFMFFCVVWRPHNETNQSHYFSGDLREDENERRKKLNLHIFWSSKCLLVQNLAWRYSQEVLRCFRLLLGCTWWLLGGRLMAQFFF